MTLNVVVLLAFRPIAGSEFEFDQCTLPIVHWSNGIIVSSRVCRMIEKVLTCLNGHIQTSRHIGIVSIVIHTNKTVPNSFLLFSSGKPSNLVQKLGFQEHLIDSLNLIFTNGASTLATILD